MKIIVTDTYEELSEKAAEIIANKIIQNSKCTLGLATGSTPIGTYKNLIKMNKEGKISFKDISTVNLDEYKGLAEDHHGSYRYFMNENLFNHIDINKKNTFVLNGLAEDDEKECKRFDEIIKNHSPISIQLLGIGENGHIGFNEPMDYFSFGTHLIKLTDNTMDVNSRFFKDGETPPHYAYTMGIKDIMMADTVLLIANGPKKAKTMKDTIEGKITPHVPASVLQLHKDAIIIGDKEAMSLLNL